MTCRHATTLPGPVARRSAILPRCRATRRSRPVGFLVLAAVLLPTALAGQQTGVLAEPGGKRLTLTFEMGNPVPDAGGGLVDQMRRAGYGDRAPVSCFFIFCSGPAEHPSPADGGPSVGVRARYALGPGLAVGLGYASSPLGGADGYRASAAARVSSHWEADIVWGSVFWTPHPTFRVGGGPAWFGLADDAAGHRFSRAGAVGELGLEVPAGSRFFIDLGIRGHLVPSSADVAYPVSSFTGEELGSVTLRPRASHLALFVGTGVRF